jgi:riboflavin biosynthesis RibT protein
MLTRYRKEQRKIAMGLLSFHKKMQHHQNLLKEVDTYEQQENFRLFLWKPVDSSNVQGVIGLEFKSPQHEEAILHDIVLSPSFRGEKVGYQMLDELLERYPQLVLEGTAATQAYLNKWKAYKSTNL